ncbi:hypothetical protein PGTUg99_033775 [Puccinia graminis f. sp. tritici]|uniref:Myb/SANT-like domain-containing protein n=1 Tax=Puccinia graminis f. sp. tritici TaxID=56615 RepID=A0A5B0PLE8_PUCGR|nr:hypothetical protein PGTUg99_033775 [Puccinia graminis f. sp. tritici]
MPPRVSKRPPCCPKRPSRPPTPPPHMSSTASQQSSALSVAAASNSSSLDHIPMSGLQIQSTEVRQDRSLPSISHMDWAASQSLPPLEYLQWGNFHPNLHSSYPPAWSSVESIQTNLAPLNPRETPAPTSTANQPCSDSGDSETPRGTTRPRTLQWTSVMEKAAIQLYYDAALEGRRLDNGFKSDVHQHVVNKLNEQFPGAEFTISKCKSKLSQSFKKEYDAFLACRNASGFGWDEIRCEVTASNDVWEHFLKSHPQARRFRNQPFPEWEQLQVIFGASATGDAAKSLTQHAKEGTVRDKPADKSSSSENDEGEGRARGKAPARKRICQTTGAAFSSAIHDLIEAFAPQSSKNLTNPEPAAALQTTERLTDEAVDLFQSTMAPQLAWSDLVVGFSVLEKLSKARMYLKLDNMYKNQWLSYEIKKDAQTI